VGRPLAGQGDLGQAAAHGLGVAAGVDLALRQLGLHAQPGQRRLELVGRVGQEVLLRPTDWSSRPSRSLMERTSGATSSGASSSSMGLRSWLSRGGCAAAAR
jgi:hypothetical protein